MKIENSAPENNHELSRRSLLTTAAWAVPVVAFAAAAPLASASPTSATHYVSGGLNQTSSAGSFTATSIASSKYVIEDAGSLGWTTGVLSAIFSLNANGGNIYTGNFFNFESGTPVALAISDTITSSDAIVWTVTSLSSTELVLSAAAIDVTSTIVEIQFPAIRSTGTYDGRPYVSYQMSIQNLSEQTDGFIQFLNNRPAPV